MSLGRGDFAGFALWLILLASEFRRNYSLDPPLLREPNVKRMVGVWGL